MLNSYKQGLVVDHLPMAKSIAYYKKCLLPYHIDINEINSAAYFGLVEAADRFDIKKGQFASYARYRIKGAILDYLRDLERCPILLDFSGDDANMAVGG